MKDTGKLSVFILDLIASLPGMRFTEIQRELYEAVHGEGTYTRKCRGWWCDQFLTTRGNGIGLLDAYCTRDPHTKRYYRNSVDHKGRPFKTMRQGS